MKRRNFVNATLGSAGLFAAAGALAQTAGPSYSWKMATGWAGGPIMDIGAKAFAERMEFFSGGRFSQYPPPGPRVPSTSPSEDTIVNTFATTG